MCARAACSPGRRAGGLPHRPGSPWLLGGPGASAPHLAPFSLWAPGAPRGPRPSRMGPWSLNSSTCEAVVVGQQAPCPEGPGGPRPVLSGRDTIPASSAGSRKSAPRPKWQKSPDVSKSKPVTLDFAGRRGCSPGLVTPILEMVLAPSTCVLVHSKALGAQDACAGPPVRQTAGDIGGQAGAGGWRRGPRVAGCPLPRGPAEPAAWTGAHLSGFQGRHGQVWLQVDFPPGHCCRPRPGRSDFPPPPRG